jgi:hypothetical protein
MARCSDHPDTHLRAALYDFTGCRILTVDTLCQIVSRLCLCKLNALIVHFEVRPTGTSTFTRQRLSVVDRFSLPYTARDIFHLQRVCHDLHIQLIPSLNLNSAYVDQTAAWDIIHQFLNAFNMCGVVASTQQRRAVHFGVHATEVILTHRALLERVKPRCVGALAYVF